jgi:D-alanyl-D-alanine-carboxypeptidase/D-alanyl-D-alanine-endopeptidase
VLQEYADRAVVEGHVGIVIGTIRDGLKEWASAGSTGSGGTRPDDRTIFRLASVSKVFTATALAVAVTRGAIALDSPVIGSITYRHLATHTSGLPRGDVTLLQALRAVPGRFEYSNVGVSALGALLGPDYEEVIRERIGLADITTVLNIEQLGRLAPGHDENGNPVVTPTYPDGAPSGGLYGTVADLLEFCVNICNRMWRSIWRSTKSSVGWSMATASGTTDRCRDTAAIWRSPRLTAPASQYSATPGYLLTNWVSG